MYKKLISIFTALIFLTACQMAQDNSDNKNQNESNISTFSSENVENQSDILENSSSQLDNPVKITDTSSVARGVDLSSLEAVEDYGGKFYDFDGTEKDPILILKENGVTFIRLRIFNNPTMSFDSGDYCNVEHTLKIAQRIKDAGLKLYLDFHYSDFWADPEKQYKPAEWENLSDDELVQAVYDYTYNTLMEFKKADIYPSIVQIGNEIGNGMLWDTGTIDNFPMLVKLLNSGIKAVRDTQPENSNTKIMIHLQDGCNKDLYKWFFDNCIANGLEDFDIIGISYYSYFHGSLEQLEDNITNLKNSYNKEIMIAETAFPYTNADMDNYTNSASSYNTGNTGYTVSVEGQKNAIKDIIEMSAKTDCIAVCYWEPAWLGVEGAGWKKGEGNSWENQCLFDFNGNALDSIKSFNYNE